MSINWQDATDSEGVQTREFVIDTERGRKVTGALWLPTTDTPIEFLMCFGHGASDDRYQEPICDLAARFQAQGIACLSVDGPVHGLRRVEPGGREALMVEMQRPGVFDDMVDDWNISVAAMRSLPALSNTQLGYFGLSMGSIFGIPFVAQRDDMIAAALGLLGTKDNTFGQTINAAAQNITIPVRFLVQLEDELFDRESCLALFDQLATTHKAMGANPGLHPEVPSDEVDAAFDFLMRQFKGLRERRVTSIISD